MKQTDKTAISERVKKFIDTVQVETNCKIVLISPDDLPYIWESVQPHLEAMEPHSEGELAPEDFYEAIHNGEMQLWLAVEGKELLASMVTQIVPYPRKQY